MRFRGEEEESFKFGISDLLPAQTWGRSERESAPAAESEIAKADFLKE